ncbi:MAG TPA: hypothetical protein VKB78_05040 [Pirellulales bacterium]|nr:hypothetical protein [Pirellulales bacterium]
MHRFILACLAIASAGASCFGNDRDLLPSFHRAGEFGDQERWTRLETGVRVYVNAPLPLAKSNRLLVVYATPNGNTIEQTLGCAKAEGRDWHFDIQHVAAQVRRLREISKDEDIVLAVAQSPKLAWPAFRQAEKNSGEIIKGIVQETSEAVGAKRIALSGHSGGGSFIFGYIDAVDQIPAWIERIVFLDANYSYSNDKKHGDKLLAWLHDNARRRLVVIAYDDREVTLDGKKIVNSTGGTFRASLRMIDRFTRDISLTEERRGPFLHRSGLGGQIEFFIHPNPDKKLLHTALVGEMNGFLHGLTLGTPLEEKWGQFGGPRAYTKWIQKDPATNDDAQGRPSNTGAPHPHPGPLPSREREPEGKPSDTSSNIENSPTLSLPPRPADAPTGLQFVRLIERLSREDREAVVLKDITRGNIPDFLRSLKPVEVEATDSQGKKHAAKYFVTPDYLAIGSDDDFFRIPMTPRTAQAIAAAANASLITAKISDDIFRHADIKVEPRPLSNDRESAATFFEHNKVIEDQRGKTPLGQLIAGIKKDVVLTNRLMEKPHRVAIYGWHQSDSKPIQPLYVGHVDWYVDYSHGIRLMSQRIIVDGRPMKVSDVLKDREICALLSNEGAITTQY